MASIKNIKAKTQIIKEMSSDQGVKQLADVFIEYLSSVDKQQIGFNNKNEQPKI